MYDQGRKKAEEIKAWRYMECSSLTQMGVKEVMEAAMRLGIPIRHQRTQRKCILL